MFNIGAMFIAALIVGFIVYLQIQKVSKKLDEVEQNPDMSRYLNLCDFIVLEIDELERGLTLGDVTLKDSKLKSEFELGVESLKNEILYIKDTYQSNQNSSVWEEKLFSFLSKFEEFVSRYLENSEAINDDIRSRLQRQF
ncbi:hypothetical protein [Campylobacter geochelonis]|uniref:Thioester dehydrase family protein n=1 Tax=Campylobacter geochelonis TaxID=1780362 RepID=A0A128EKP1_9BACT|nr:hypothetical protein [Campylobacter geochelonis]QKF71134.1 hypothetical protein CGEO_0815 [Campylobacter geochelonis]CZE48262.1 thioester dehydrase family protein [Campylobacter geochelonis]CZE48962.1 thioester dehydrase family protein [Campylobacter geochelonis]